MGVQRLVFNYSASTSTFVRKRPGATPAHEKRATGKQGGTGVGRAAEVMGGRDSRCGGASVIIRPEAVLGMVDGMLRWAVGVAVAASRLGEHRPGLLSSNPIQTTSTSLHAPSPSFSSSPVVQPSPRTAARAVHPELGSVSFPLNDA
jgi:hypothetical protein